MESFVGNEDDHISDDSSFYGDDEVKQQLESQAESFSVEAYRSTSRINLTALALKNMLVDKAAKQKKPVKLLNRLEGERHARQLAESIPEFLKRLPPYTTQQSEIGPFIWILNPYAPPSAGKIAAFKAAGSIILDDLTARKASLEASMKGKAKSTITKKYIPLRLAAEQAILKAAQEAGVTDGKWMLFPMPEDVNRTWRIVAEATAKGELGTGAKVAADKGEGDREPRLICVYTTDFTDLKDVKRVLETMVEKGLVKRRAGSRISYKCDAYTYLDIATGNGWGIKPSIYGSKDVLADLE